MPPPPEPAPSAARPSCRAASESPRAASESPRCIRVAARCIRVVVRCIRVAARCIRVVVRCIRVAARCIRVAACSHGHIGVIRGLLGISESLGEARGRGRGRAGVRLARSAGVASYCGAGPAIASCCACLRRGSGQGGYCSARRPLLHHAMRRLSHRGRGRRRSAPAARRGRRGSWP